MGNRKRRKKRSKQKRVRLHLQRVMGVERIHIFVDELWEWKERKKDLEHFDRIVMGKMIEEGRPLEELLGYNRDEYEDCEQPEMAGLEEEEELELEELEEKCAEDEEESEILEIEMTDHPLNLFGDYLVKKYGIKKGLFFFKIYLCEEMRMYWPQRQEEYQRN